MGIFSNNKKTRRIISMWSLSFYIISLFCPAIIWTVSQLTTDLTRTQSFESVFGYEVLVQGPLGIIYGIEAWYANLLYVVVLLAFLFNRQIINLIFTVGILILFMSLPSFFSPSFSFPLDEGSVRIASAPRMYIGAYLWMISLLLPGIFGLIFSLTGRDSKASAKISEDIPRKPPVSPLAQTNRTVSYCPTWWLFVMGLVIPLTFIFLVKYLVPYAFQEFYLFVAVLINLLLWITFRFLSKRLFTAGELNLFAYLSSASLTFVSIYIFINLTIFFLIFILAISGQLISLTFDWDSLRQVIIFVLIYAAPIVTFYTAYQFLNQIRHLSTQKKPTWYFILGSLTAIIVFLFLALIF